MKCSILLFHHKFIGWSTCDDSLQKTLDVHLVKGFYSGVPQGGQLGPLIISVAHQSEKLQQNFL